MSCFPSKVEETVRTRLENWLAKIFGESFPFGDVLEADFPPRAGGSEKNKGEGELLKLKTTRVFDKEDAREGLADDFKQVNSKFSSATSRFLELDQVFNA